MHQKRLPPLHALRAFEAVGRRGSFKEAAVELSVTPAALSQQVKKLEADLGVELLRRGNRRIALTSAGRRLQTGLSHGIAMIRGAVATVAS